MIKLFLSTFLMVFSFCLAEYRYELSFCTIFRNDANYLKEWIEFHRLVGVQHFYLCAHNTNDNSKEVLMPYIKQGIVDLVELTTENEEEGLVHFCVNIQSKFYTNCLKNAKGISKWVAFIDTDEYLFPSEKYSLLEVLKDFDNEAGIGVNWQLFGTSKVEKIKDTELLIEVLTSCAHTDYPNNLHIKSIVKPEFAIEFQNPHYANYLDKYSQVNTDKVPFQGPFSPYIKVDKLRINHYWLRDEYYFITNKLPRGIRWGYPDIMKHYEELNKFTDKTIHRYVLDLKKNLKMN